MWELFEAVAPFLNDAVTEAAGQEAGADVLPQAGGEPAPSTLPASGASASSQEAHQEGQPESSHLAPHQGEVGKKKLLSVLERHLRRHCASQAITQKFPYVLDLKQKDFEYFSQHIAISELDIEYQTDIEMANLADYIKNYNRVKPLLDHFFESYY